MTRRKSATIIVDSLQGLRLAPASPRGTWLYRMWHKKIDWNEEDPLSAMGGSRGGFTLGGLIKANATLQPDGPEPYEVPRHCLP